MTTVTMMTTAMMTMMRKITVAATRTRRRTKTTTMTMMMMTTTTTKTTTDSSLRSSSWRPPTGAAIALLLLVTACSSTLDSVATTAVDGSVAPTTVEAPTTTVDPPDPSELLADALQRYSAGYEFRASAAVNDQEATVQAGRWLDGASQITVQSGDGEVEYIITAAGQWVRLPDGEWEEIEAAPSVAYPLEAMTTPDSLELIASTGDTVSVSAFYPAAVVGLSGDPVEVVLDFEKGNLVGVSFTVDADGNIIESTTSLSPLADATPIVAPTS
jgi:hypothetical protein